MLTIEIKLGIAFVVLLVLTIVFMPEQEEHIPPAYTGGILIQTPDTR